MYSMITAAVKIVCGTVAPIFLAVVYMTDFNECIICSMQVVVGSTQWVLQCLDQYLTTLSQQNFARMLLDRYITVSL